MPNLTNLLIIFTVIFVVGYFLSYYLYKINNKQFKKSALQIKILLWIPIFAVFLVFIYGNIAIKYIVITFILINVIVEVLNNYQKSKQKSVVVAYGLLISLCILTILPISVNSNVLVIALCFSSVMSDVFAFFFGNFFGRHKLPPFINNKKNWEGVIGQIVGAFIGIVLINSFVGHINLLIFIPIALGSALGDLINSTVKRKENIKDWSSSLPGHGGYLDRFSSLGIACLLVFLTL